MFGYLAGSFLRPVRFGIPLPWGGEYKFTSALIFDLGVYFAVVAIIIALLNELGGVRQRHGDLPEGPDLDSSDVDAPKESVR